MGKAEPCRFCKTDKYLKWKFLDDKIWIHCDSCGQVSDPKTSQLETGEDWNANNASNLTR